MSSVSSADENYITFGTMKFGMPSASPAAPAAPAPAPAPAAPAAPAAPVDSVAAPPAASPPAAPAAPVDSVAVHTDTTHVPVVDSVAPAVVADPTPTVPAVDSVADPTPHRPTDTTTVAPAASPVVASSVAVPSSIPVPPPSIPAVSSSLPVADTSSVPVGSSSDSSIEPIKFKSIYYVHSINEVFEGDFLIKNPTYKLTHLVFETTNGSKFVFKIDGYITNIETDKYIRCSDEVLIAINQLYTGLYYEMTQIEKDIFNGKYLKNSFHVNSEGIHETTGSVSSTTSSVRGGDDTKPAKLEVEPAKLEVEPAAPLPDPLASSIASLAPAASLAAAAPTDSSSSLASSSPSITQVSSLSSVSSSMSPVSSSSTSSTKNVKVIYGLLYLDIETLEPNEFLYYKTSDQVKITKEFEDNYERQIIGIDGMNVNLDGGDCNKYLDEIEKETK
jgi:hypothetical protein